MQGIDCPMCIGSGFVAATGEGLYAFLTTTKARVQRLIHGALRARAMLHRYLREGLECDRRIAPCRAEIHGYRVSIAVHRRALRALRNLDTIAVCISCRGERVVDTTHHDTSDSLVLVLDYDICHRGGVMSHVNPRAASGERRRLPDGTYGPSSAPKVADRPEYNTWEGIKQRCHNPNEKRYAEYGGRGITVCVRWRESFEAFLADVGSRPSPEHSLDRLDNDRGYEPGNVRWATRSQQQRNRRTTNHRLTFRGETRCVTEWAEILGISERTLRARAVRGWSAERALTTPVQPRVHSTGRSA